MKNTVNEEKINQANKSGNSVLNSAKYSSDNTDEWYTAYETIAEEVCHYKDCTHGIYMAGAILF